MMSDADRKALLGIVRATLEAILARRPKPAAPADESEALRARCGCFVTLKNRGALRGCIGTFTARGPLHQTVREMAGAVLRDPRFLDHPVTAEELPHVEIEISALTPLEKTADPMKEIELGRHGICIEGPMGNGCFLPQVATQTGWTLPEFLSHCCAGKAGIPPDAWKDPDVTVFRFEAEVFGEKDIA